MADTFTKKEFQKKRARKKLDKAEKREERKTNNNKGKSLDEMTVYLDENGNITDLPPDKQIKRKTTEPTPGDSVSHSPTELTGTVALLFPDKGYGFITEDNSRSNVFVHNNQMQEPLQEKDRVSFRKEKTPKGFAAVNVKKIS